MKVKLEKLVWLLAGNIMKMEKKCFVRVWSKPSILRRIQSLGKRLKDIF
ncbi:hypothetical protein MTR67_016319 [Solanum verrucosum]|uniref:Uncharacterized protein n=1 Tax=Solanum verrucosum TaxID=315347 RepID=A0AAF0QFW3_SOLVR|nr:hypothetical protein MTR67_016319 [Solanum verrucosum]